jgi:hypothetical protein
VLEKTLGKELVFHVSKKNRQTPKFAECISCNTWKKVVCRVPEAGSWHSSNPPTLNIYEISYNDWVVLHCNYSRAWTGDFGTLD